jgi:Thioredoxin
LWRLFYYRMTPPITPALWAQALPYPAYRALADARFAEGRSTSNDPYFNTPKNIEYTALNLKRMDRLEQVPPLEPATIAAAQAVVRPVLALVITESWCGDGAQTVPVLHRIAEASGGRLELRVVLRDEHPDLIDAFLTNGGRSIPKVLFLDPLTLDVLTTWGPRPAPAQTFVREAIAAGMPYDERNTKLHTWYAHDKTATTQAEIREILGLVK